MSKYLHGIHDPGGERLMDDKPGWIIHTVALSEISSFDYSSWANRGFTNIVRLNWAYHPNGTIPPDTIGNMVDFANRCANFIAISPGANIYIIGNEPNHQIEWPNDDKITAERYAAQFNQCWLAMKKVRPNVQILTAAVALWNPHSGDWLDYFRRMLGNIADCDGIALHGYTHGTDPSLIYNQEKRNGWYWHFPIVYQQIENIPLKFKLKPIHVTETDQGDDAWADNNSGWVKNAFASVHHHNQTPGTQKIMSLSLYRWQTHDNDKWHFEDKRGVQNDFRDVVNIGYPSPMMLTPPKDNDIFLPEVGKGESPVNVNDTARVVDPRAVKPNRDVYVLTPPLVNGQKYWFASEIHWLDKIQSQGRHHIYGNVYDEKGVELFGEELEIAWPNPITPDDTAKVTTKKDPVSPYSYNYNMSKSLKEFSVKVINGDMPTEIVAGIGMGMDGNPAEHTSTVVKWRIRTYVESQAVEPEPTPEVPITAKIMTLPTSGVITQRFGENPADYARFGQAGHNGLDLANAEGTQIVSAAPGLVKMINFDNDYGYYVRIWHPALRLHTFYAHLQEGSFLVKIGQQVNRGDPIARMGNTGNSTGPHLHFETRLGTENDYMRGQFGYTQGRVDPETVLYLQGAISGV